MNKHFFCSFLFYCIKNISVKGHRRTMRPKLLSDGKANWRPIKSQSPQTKCKSRIGVSFSGISRWITSNQLDWKKSISNCCNSYAHDNSIIIYHSWCVAFLNHSNNPDTVRFVSWLGNDDIIVFVKPCLSSSLVLSLSCTTYILC